MCYINISSTFGAIKNKYDFTFSNAFYQDILTERLFAGNEEMSEVYIHNILFFL